MNEEKKNELIDEVMDDFDFHKVQKCMEALEWTYHDSEEIPPPIPDLRKTARRLLRSVLNEKIVCCATGGFVATYYDNILSLRFEVESFDLDTLTKEQL